MSLTRPRQTWYVDGYRGYPRRTGRSAGRGYLTIGEAVTAAEAGDRVQIAHKPDGYNEEVTIPRAKPGLTIVGVGPRGAIYIAPQTGSKTALTILADDVRLENLGLAGLGTGSGLISYGRRVRGSRCKIEGGAIALKLTNGTAAQVAALTHGDGSDSDWEDCEIAWATRGVMLSVAGDGSTYYGSISQPRFKGCLFHNLSAAAIDSEGGPGTGADRFRDLRLEDNTFGNQEDGSEPTLYLNLAPHADNSGHVVGNRFLVASASAKILTATKLVRGLNYYTDGLK